ncbi:DUF4272 domain-containing protein [Flavobacterium sp. NRK1]|uniref:DUF4272 domain-containing protein n=1 Tax=Flavobacterium sp. NRK1 TaxID=2954929 RepID=UPI0020926C07|nr:DUF4272 domain-containing protein [Flavobacterium sp. NRK1]MCO6146838.1 DUF4272 domain-containing protein [Flavobacterium sp. NRK1]
MFSLFRKKKQSRKEKSEELLKKSGIKTNDWLPDIEPDEEIILRSPVEIAERVTILCIINFVAFNTFSGEEALEYIHYHNLSNLLTPLEIEFLNNPTEEKKFKESWKCEGIWVLLWSLNIVEDLEFPDHLCDLNKITPENYPIGDKKDPNDFINNSWELRSKSQILDANDLYYRMDWACVDARINGKEMQIVHPGVVYERHYALNWLINYMDQEWDDISCDT